MFAVEGTYLNFSFKTILFFILPEASHLPVTQANMIHRLHFYNSGHTLYFKHYY